MSKLDAEQLSEIVENFTHFDEDHNGFIDYEEFKRLVNVLPGDMSEEEMRIGFDIVDVDNNGRIDCDEFIQWWQDQV